MKPRDSTPTTTSTLSDRYLAARWSITYRHAGPSFRSVVMSLKRMPSVGKSLMSRILARSSASSMAPHPKPGLRRRQQRRPRATRRRGSAPDRELGRRDAALGGCEVDDGLLVGLDVDAHLPQPD